MKVNKMYWKKFNLRERSEEDKDDEPVNDLLLKRQDCIE